MPIFIKQGYCTGMGWLFQLSNLWLCCNFSLQYSSIHCINGWEYVSYDMSMGHISTSESSSFITKTYIIKIYLCVIILDFSLKHVHVYTFVNGSSFHTSNIIWMGITMVFMLSSARFRWREALGYFARPLPRWKSA